TRRRVIGAHQRGMLMRTPLVQANQDRAIRVDDLAPVLVGRRRRRLTKQSLGPPETGRHVANAHHRPCALHPTPRPPVTLRRTAPYTLAQREWVLDLPLKRY